MKLSELIAQLEVIANSTDSDPEIRLLTDPKGKGGQSRFSSVFEDVCDEEGMDVVVFNPDFKS